MMDVSINVKCAITTAILSVLVYLLLVNLLTRVWGSDVGKEMTQKITNESGTSVIENTWYKSMEVIMLVSVFIAFNFNGYLFSSCRSA